MTRDERNRVVSRVSSEILICAAIACLPCGGCSFFPARPASAPQSAMADANVINQVRGASPDSDSGTPPTVRLGVPEPIDGAEREPMPCDVLSEARSDRDRAEPLGKTLWEQDKNEFLPLLRQDLLNLITLENGMVLLAGGAASWAIAETLDDDVADYTRRHPNRWGEFQDVMGGIGNPLHHLAAASGIYAYSLITQDSEAHDLGNSLLHATATTLLATTALKFVANTTRPNGDSRGWPSGHTASSVAWATVLHEYYGHKVGIPAFALAGLVAWERLDDREHDLSDVVFGAALGFVIGRTFASDHRVKIWGMEVEPYADLESGATGVSLERRY